MSRGEYVVASGMLVATGPDDSRVTLQRGEDLPAECVGEEFDRFVSLGAVLPKAEFEAKVASEADELAGARARPLPGVGHEDDVELAPESPDAPKRTARRK